MATTHEGHPVDTGGAVSIMIASAARAMPMRLVFNLPPSSTFLNQVAAWKCAAKATDTTLVKYLPGSCK